jgi:hypothetical protein
MTGSKEIYLYEPHSQVAPIPGKKQLFLRNIQKRNLAIDNE